MKSLSTYKFIPYFIFITAFIACANDTTQNDETALIGVWQRSDVSESFDYQLVFLEKNLGYKTESEGTSDLAISSAITFNWSIKNKQLLLTLPDTITTSYTFNSNGQLLLNDLTSLPFNKLEE